MNKTIALKRNTDETYLQFITRALQDLKIITKRTKSIQVPYLNETTTYFIYEGNQVTLTKAENNFYEISVDPLPSSFDIRYGCELETCFVLNCSSNEFDEYIVKKLKEKKDEEDEKKELKDWKELILFHIEKNLIPKFSKEFIKRFPYAYIMGYHSQDATYIDLSSGEVIYDVKEIDNYNTLQFAQDGSVECGDSNDKDSSLTVHCEIISPILKNISEIKLIYENVISEACNVSNESAGFHVNVSIVDSKDSKTIKLTPGILFEICKLWYPFEKKHYTEYRGDGSIYAINMSKITDDIEFMKIIFNKKDGSLIKESDILVPESHYGIRTLFDMERIKNKFTSLHLKNNDILEFRVFPSKNKLDELVDYTKKSISIIKKGIKNIIEHSEIISEKYNQLFSIYTPTNYYHFDPYNFTGPLSYYNKLSSVLNGVENPLEFYFFEYNLESSFLFFFTIHRQIKSIQEGEHYYIFKNPFDKTIVKYYIKYLPKENFVQIYQL
jgi:hypothetical protein